MTMPGAGGPSTDRGFWDDQWDERSRRGLSERLLHGRDFGARGAFLRLLKAQLPDVALKGARVVELGGAASRYLIDLALCEGARVTAIDYSAVGIARTRELFAKAGVSGEAIRADMFLWQNDGEPFDLVVHFGVLEHFSDPLPLIATSARLLRPDGTVFFTMPNLGALGARLWQRNAPQNYAAHVFHSDDAIAAACRESGLELRKVFWFGPPLIRMAPAQKRGVIEVLSDLGHAAVCIAGTIAPSIYLKGHRAISNQRGFVAVKVRS
ncbi:MAG: class I SAM-dependent methyltransferase [Alphaproteobacteria bacterium]|nr:class I SAM-dependent methyltransferase [Alphaproteobacteria bacterium]